MSIPDAYDAWRNHERQQERWLERRPVCDHCKDHIQRGHCYRIWDITICPDCMEDYFKERITE